MILPTFVPELAKLNEKKLQFSSAIAKENALRNGCFALLIPHYIDLKPGKKLAAEFYQDPEKTLGGTQSYRGYRDQSELYFDREHFQTEHILTDHLQRQSLLPVAVNMMCDDLHTLATLILLNVLHETGIAPPLWSHVTHSASQGGGIKWFAVSHYRTERHQLGAPAHKDTGFVTILFCNQPGLEVFVNNQWMTLNPIPEHFLINFGGALEALTMYLPIPVHAVLHRVRQCLPHPSGEDRYSFAVFLNPPVSGELFQTSTDGKTAKPLMSVETFLRQFNEETWQDSYVNFGISQQHEYFPSSTQ